MQENENQHEKTIENSKWSQNGANATRSRAHLSYWETVVFQREGGNWHVQIRHAGRRMKLSLGTPVRTAAVARARDFYLTLLDHGWDEALRSLRPQTAPRDRSTVGDFLEELRAVADLKPTTFKDYAVALRKIVSDIFQIDSSGKHDHRGGGDQYWLKRVHAVKLDELTPARIQQWKLNYLARAGADPLRLRSARISVNSLMRRAKSLFSPDATKHLTKVPSSPFEGVRFEKRQNMRYRSEIDVRQLVHAAQTELALVDPPVFLAFTLALTCGLRRLEIDRLQWSAVLWDQNIISIETTEFFEPKTESSTGDILVDAEVMEILRGYAARARSNFVIDVPTPPSKRVTFQNYRAEKVFERLCSWLRAKGITSRTPLHMLRKEFGSQVCAKHGIYAASRMLRHSGIAITEQHYLDDPRRTTAGLGSLFQALGDDKIVELEKASAHR